AADYGAVSLSAVVAPTFQPLVVATYFASTASRGRHPARARTTGSISATDHVVTAGASIGAAALPSGPRLARPWNTFPAVKTGLIVVMRNALSTLPPSDFAVGPSVKSELTRLPLASFSKRTPQSVQSSMMSFRMSATMLVDTSGPRAHCFIIQL